MGGCDAAVRLIVQIYNQCMHEWMVVNSKNTVLLILTVSIIESKINLEIGMNYEMLFFLVPLAFMVFGAIWVKKNPVGPKKQS